MRLKSINYVQFKGTSREWSLTDLTLKPINLIVGKNAIGKTRTLNVIHGLGKLVSGRQTPAEITTGTYHTTFEHDEGVLYYSLDIQDRKVISEEFRVGDRTLLKRGAGGIGTIFHEKENKEIEFQTPEAQAAVVARRDTIQHRFLESLNHWGAGVRHYAFGETMGRNTIAVLVPNGPKPDPADVNAVIALFRKAAKDFPVAFDRSVKDDMNKIGYNIVQIGVMLPTDITIEVASPVPVSPSVLFVRERDLPDVTQQTDMSQGMFRALSVIILLNYAAFATRPSCIIIDDIGEGLDYDRSCRLIDLVRQKARESSVQLIMGTNDRFVMNSVPLEEWSVLQRESGTVKVRNYENSKPFFDQFKFTGLNNFDFLATDFLNEGAKHLPGEIDGPGARNSEQAQ